jgi:hypothetical protein
VLRFGRQRSCWKTYRSGYTDDSENYGGNSTYDKVDRSADRGNYTALKGTSGKERKMYEHTMICDFRYSIFRFSVNVGNTCGLQFISTIGTDISALLFYT